MTSDTKKQLLRAKKLIQAGNYQQAQELLWDIDHPQADIWLAKLERRMDSTGKKKSSSDNIWLWVGVAITFAVVILVATAFIASNQMGSQSGTSEDNNEGSSNTFTIMVTPTQVRGYDTAVRTCTVILENQGIRPEFDTYESRLEDCINNKLSCVIQLGENITSECLQNLHSTGG